MMILLSLLFLLAVKAETDICTLPKEPGLCKAYFPRYFYNSATKQCEDFIYGGCGGNENNFESLKECKAECDIDICSLRKDAGPCKGYFPRYFYNSATKQCDDFIYGGCGGNENNFESLKECKAECDICSLRSDPGPCKAAIPRYFYNSKAGECRPFTYGGCKGNANNFETLADCEDRCESGPDCSLVRCAYPKCESGQSTVIPDGECCPVCCEQVQCITAPCPCMPISNEAGSAFVIQLESPWVVAMICVLGVALLCNIIFMCYTNCNKTRKGKGYYVVKEVDSEDLENSEINPINVN